jgi:hypothetical protein
LLRTILEMLLPAENLNLSRIRGIKQLDFLNAGHSQHFSPKMLGFTPKRLFTSLTIISGYKLATHNFFI